MFRRYLKIRGAGKTDLSVTLTWYRGDTANGGCCCERMQTEKRRCLRGQLPEWAGNRKRNGNSEQLTFFLFSSLKR